MPDSHSHGHSHKEAHAPIGEDTPAAPENILLEQALRELLIQKEFFSAADITKEINDFDSITPSQGARVVAKFWADPTFRRQAQADGKKAVESLGIDMSMAPELVFLENTPTLHNVVVCTLCSCYPRAVLGLPPAWYKSAEYRSRTVTDPRAVLKEFGTTFPSEVEIRVADSTADMRYLVVPVRPEGTEGMSEEKLAELVTRDSMIGVTGALPKT